ncbi:MAG: hypothetical protein ACKVW3_10930 [Phycisphaerales bacterium]
MPVPIGLIVEALEPRALLATIAWDGGPAGTGTDWHGAANWVGDVLPGPSDDVVIDIGANHTIVMNATGTTSINSLVLRENLNLTTGTLAVAAVATVTAVTLNLQGGGLLGGQWNVAAGTLAANSNANNKLDGVSLTGTLSIGSTNGVITVQNGLTLNGTISMRGSARLTLAGTQSITTTSTGTIFSDPAVLGTRTITFTGDMAEVTLQAGVTLRGSQAIITGSVTNNQTLRNLGLISVDSSGSFTVQQLRIVNNTTIKAKNAGQFNINSGGLSGNARATSVLS